MSGRRGAPDGAGVGRSYGELYVEYAPAARGLALSMVPPDVADDIVAEAFARVLAAIRAGGGPDHAFRPYLLAAVRNLANDWIAARRRVTVIGDLDEEAGDRSALLTSGFSGDAETEAEARAWPHTGNRAQIVAAHQLDGLATEQALAIVLPLVE